MGGVGRQFGLFLRADGHHCETCTDNNHPNTSPVLNIQKQYFTHHLSFRWCPFDTAFRMKESIPTIMLYSKAELMPPKPSEFGEVSQGIRNIMSSFRSGAWKNLTVREAVLNSLIVTEIAMWFFAGEVIGRRNIVGYHQNL